MIPLFTGLLILSNLLTSITMTKPTFRPPPFLFSTHGSDYAVYLKVAFEHNDQKKSVMDREELLKSWTTLCNSQLPKSRREETIAQFSRVCSTTLDNALPTNFTGDQESKSAALETELSAIRY